MTTRVSGWTLPRPLGASGAPAWLSFGTEAPPERVVLGGVLARRSQGGMFVIDALRRPREAASEPRTEHLRIDPPGAPPRAIVWSAPDGEPPTDPSPHALLLASTSAPGRARLDLFETDHEAAATLRRQWIAACRDPELRGFARFFADLDATYHPSRASTCPTAASGLRLAQTLQDRTRRRGLDHRLGRPFRADHGLDALRPGDVETVEADLDARFAAARFDAPLRLHRAFLAFVGGELHVADRIDLNDSPPRVLDSIGAPNGTFFPSFAEAALLFASLPGRATAWRTRIPPLLGATRQFFATYRRSDARRSPASYSPRWRRPTPWGHFTPPAAQISPGLRMARLAWLGYRDHVEACVPLA